MSESTQNLETQITFDLNPFDSYLITIPAEYRFYKTQFRLGRMTYGHCPFSLGPTLSY
jgi:hypothetical protein